MHRRNLSNENIKASLDVTPRSTLLQFPTLKTIRNKTTSKRFRKLQYVSFIKSSSPVKNLEILVDRCNKELKNIKKITGCLLKSKKKIARNHEVLNDFIHRPMYSIKVLKLEKPHFLNRKLKYENVFNR